MKNYIFFLLLLDFVSCAEAASTIDAGNNYAYAANLGWLDWYAGGENGVIISEYVCSGYIWSGNCGWINLGSGSPANGIQYQNNSATDFGVNQDALGNLSGYAYSANIGWIAFEQSYGKPNVNPVTGLFSGSIWSANCGWIPLSNVVAYVQTDTIQKGVLASNGLPIAWLLLNFGTTNINANADPTGKGFTIAEDYLAGTDPSNPQSILKIATESISPNGTTASLTWNSVPSRYYYLQETTDLTMPTWTDCGLGLISPADTSITSRSFIDTAAPSRFYRVQAVRPLIP